MVALFCMIDILWSSFVNSRYSSILQDNVLVPGGVKMLDFPLGLLGGGGCWEGLPGGIWGN
jgi:hypothetical protein